MSYVTRATFGIFLLAHNLLGASIGKFALEYFKHPTQVGALFECSQTTAQELLRYAQQLPLSRHIIELGAGMGSITKVIVEQLKPGDELDVIEINPKYCVHLRSLFPQQKYKNVHIHCVDVLEFAREHYYDAVICTLPFNLFDAGLIVRMQEKIKNLVKKDAYFSYVEYSVLPQIRAFLTIDHTQARLLQERAELMQKFKQKYLIKTTFVMRNLFPLHVHHLKINT